MCEIVGVKVLMKYEYVLDIREICSVELLFFNLGKFLSFD